MFGSEKIRGIIWQALLLAAVRVSGWYLFSNTQANLARSNIQVGFGFLDKEAGFEIAESLIGYSATDTTFPSAGRVALWTKADSITHFDDLRIQTL